MDTSNKMTDKMIKHWWEYKKLEDVKVIQTPQKGIIKYFIFCFTRNI